MADKIKQQQMVQIFTEIFTRLGYIPSRDEFIQYSSITQKSVVTEFGSYTGLINASGLCPKRIIKTYGERKYEIEHKKFEDITNIYEKYETEIKPYYGRFDRKIEGQSMAACISDSHSQFWDEFTWLVFFDFISSAQPELIILGGDLLEFYRISFHSKDPTRAMSMQDEIDFVVEKKLKKIRSLCPKAQIDYHWGNHENRLFRYLSEQAPALCSLRSLQIHKLLQLEELEINLVAKDNFVFNPKKDKENYKVYQDKFVWHHGTSTGVFPAKDELLSFGLSGASGHVHRHTVQSRRNLHGYITWHTLGSSCTNTVGRDYIPSLIHWSQGFNIVHFHKFGVTQEYIDTTNGFACIGGKFFYKKDLTK